MKESATSSFFLRLRSKYSPQRSVFSQVYRNTGDKVPYSYNKHKQNRVFYILILMCLDRKRGNKRF
jgi:hypothetical protein